MHVTVMHLCNDVRVRLLFLPALYMIFDNALFRLVSLYPFRVAEDTLQLIRLLFIYGVQPFIKISLLLDMLGKGRKLFLTSVIYY